jgi:gliding motility-associated-like protein
MSYYAVSNNDTASCSSDATEIVVTITDPAAPALSMEGDEFCRSDNPTVQDLINNFSGSGVLVYPSSTGGSAISATTALQNGVTYYGASVNGTTGCESSERLAVVAKVEFCGIPEGFSPNGDGINDRFVIPDIAETFPNYSIEIFNRWGNAVFKGNANTGDWDGISNQSGTLGNDVLPVGVYFYILNYNDGQTTPVQGKLYLSI